MCNFEFDDEISALENELTTVQDIRNVGRVKGHDAQVVEDGRCRMQRERRVQPTVWNRDTCMEVDGRRGGRRGQ